MGSQAMAAQTAAWGEFPYNRRPYYTECEGQPIDMIAEAGSLRDYCRGNIVKYVLRFERKNGLEDLLKARQYLHWLIGE